MFLKKSISAVLTELKKSKKILRRRYKRILNNGVSVACDEWISDNYYLLVRSADRTIDSLKNIRRSKAIHGGIAVLSESACSVIISSEGKSADIIGFVKASVYGNKHVGDLSVLRSSAVLHGLTYVAAQRNEIYIILLICKFKLLCKKRQHKACMGGFMAVI